MLVRRNSQLIQPKHLYWQHPYPRHRPPTEPNPELFPVAVKTRKINRKIPAPTRRTSLTRKETERWDNWKIPNNYFKLYALNSILITIIIYYLIMKNVYRLQPTNLPINVDGLGLRMSLTTMSINKKKYVYSDALNANSRPLQYTKLYSIGTSTSVTTGFHANIVERWLVKAAPWNDTLRKLVAVTKHCNILWTKLINW